MMADYQTRLRKLGLSETQLVTILSGWTVDGIDALLNGETTPPSNEGLAEAILAYGGCD
jgi:hypothetical protein